ncbi:MAG: hypothetical protein ACKOPT_16310 [Cyanobium sp.]
MSALFGLPPPLMRLLAIVMVAAVIALVAWALQLMQAANDRKEFSLMLAGCMVCSAAVGLSTVMLLTFTSPEAFSPPPLAPDLAASPLLWEGESLPASR